MTRPFDGSEPLFGVPNTTPPAQPPQQRTAVQLIDQSVQDNTGATVIPAQPRKYDGSEPLFADDTEPTRAAIMRAQRIDPAQAAKALELGKRTGLPADIVLADPQKVENITQFDEAVIDLSAAPVLSAELSRDHVLAAASRRDWKALAKMEGVARDPFELVADAARAGGSLALTTAKGAVVEGPMILGEAAFDFAAAAIDLANDASGAAAIRAIDEARGEDTQQTWLGAAADFMRERAQRSREARDWFRSDFELDGPIKRGIYGAGVSLVPSAFALLSGGALGTSAGAMASVSATVGALPETLALVSAGREAGQPIGEAIRRAIPTFAAEAVFERYTDELLFKALRTGFTNAGAVKQFAAEILGEQATQLTEDVDAVLQGRQGLQETIDSYPENALEVFVSTLVGTAVQVGGVQALRSWSQRVSNDVGTVAESKIANARAETLLDAAHGSELRESNPAAFAELVNRMGQAGGFAQVYIAGEDLTAALNEVGTPIEQLGDVFPSLKGKEGNLLAGDEIAIPIGELLAAAKDVKLESALRPRLRAKAGGLSNEEITAAEALSREYMNEASTELQDELARAAQLQEDAQRVREQVTAAIQATGKFAGEQTNIASAWVSSFYTTMAERLGVRPSELYAAHPYNVTASELFAPASMFSGLAQTQEQQRGTSLSGAPAAEGALPPMKVTHFSRRAGLTTLRGDAFGSGFRSEERNRVIAAEDQRTKRRVYFYAGPAEENAGKWPGTYVYETTLGNIYDATEDPLGIAKRLREQGLKGNAFSDAFESAVLDAGFDGYLNRQHGEGEAGVILNADVPVTERGRAEDFQAAPKTTDTSPEATAEDFSTPDGIKGILGKKNWAILTAANPDAKPLSMIENRARNAQLKADLAAIDGVEVLEAEGHYGIPESSFIVTGITEEQALELGKKYGQESVLTPRGLLYADGRLAPATGVEVFSSAPREGNYTTVFPPRRHSVSFRVNLDFNGFEQGTDTGARGMYMPSDEAIVLLANSDITTLVHETGHFFLDLTMKLAAQANAPADLVQDAQTLLDWFGVPDLATWAGMTMDEQRAAHEKFAEATELYVYNGQAPSRGLRRVFAKFREFFLNALDRMRALVKARGGDLTPEVIAVMDRLYATQAEIDVVKRTAAQLPAFNSAEEMGVTQEQWEEFQRLVQDADEEALNYLRTRSLRDLKYVFNTLDKELRAARRELNSLRNGVEGEVVREASTIPALNVRRWLTNGTLPDGTKTVGAKLYTEELRARLGDGPAAPWRYLPSTVLSASQDGTLPIDTVGEMFGYGPGNGDQMVRDMVAVGDEKTWIENRVSEIMLKRYGEAYSPQAMREAAFAAVHNKVRARAIATELEALTRANKVTRRTARGGRVNVILEAARRVAARRGAATPVRELSMTRELAAAKRAGDAMLRAMASGDTQGAIRHKRNQLLHEVTAREAHDAKDELRIALRKLRKIGRTKTMRGVAQEYLDRVHDLLSSVDLNDVSRPQAERRQAIRTWLDNQRAQGFTPLLSDALINKLGRTPYQDLTVGEMRELRDAVDSLLHLGRLKQKLLTSAKKREFEATAAEIADTIRANAVKRHVATFDAPTQFDDLRKAVRGFLLSHRTMGSIVRQLDGLNNPGGPLWDALIRPMNERSAIEHNRLHEEGNRITALTRGIIGGAGRQRVLVPEVGARMSLEARIAVALNYGNLDNRQRLLDGNRWTDAQAQAVMRTLTAEQLRLVNQVWSYLDSFWPEIESLYKRLTGVAPKRVEAAPFIVESADGQTVEMRGGYYPISYDRARSGAPEGDPAALAGNMIAGNPAGGYVMTKHGFTESRAAEVHDAALRLDLGVLGEHVRQVVHDLTWHEWLVDANRLLDSRGAVAQAIRETMGPEALEELKKGVKAIALGDVQTHDAVERLFRWMRNGSTMVSLGFNASTSLMQVAGASQAMRTIGEKWFAVGLWQYLGTPQHMRKVVQAVHEASPVMRARSETFHAGVREAVLTARDRGTLERTLNRLAFWPIAKMQAAVDIPLWLGAYAKALKMFDGDVKKAAAWADDAVIASQGGGAAEMVPSALRGDGFKRVFTNFMSFMNATYNQTAESWHRTNFKSPVDVARFAADLMELYFIPAALTGILFGALRAGEPPEDPEDVIADYAVELLRYSTGGIVGVRELTAAATGVYGYTGPPGTRFISEFGRFAKGVANGDFDEEFTLRAGATAAGIALHLPTGQFDKTLRGLMAFQDGDAPSTAILLGPPPNR